jgi:hypothetical protein
VHQQRFQGFACYLILDAGLDTNVCAPGGTISLMNTLTGNGLFYQGTLATRRNYLSIINPGVYVYNVDVRLRDGRQVVEYADVTVAR